MTGGKCYLTSEAPLALKAFIASSLSSGQAIGEAKARAMSDITVRSHIVCRGSMTGCIHTRRKIEKETKRDHAKDLIANHRGHHMTSCKGEL